MLLSIGIFSTTALAYASEAPAETTQEQTEETVPETSEPMKPLTPEMCIRDRYEAVDGWRWCRYDLNLTGSIAFPIVWLNRKMR